MDCACHFSDYDLPFFTELANRLNLPFTLARQSILDDAKAVATIVVDPSMEMRYHNDGNNWCHMSFQNETIDKCGIAQENRSSGQVKAKLGTKFP